MLSLLKYLTKNNYGFCNRNVSQRKSFRQKSTRDKSLIKLPKSPAIMASGISTNILPENLSGLCDRFKLLLEEKSSRKNSD